MGIIVLLMVVVWLGLMVAGVFLWIGRAAKAVHYVGSKAVEGVSQIRSNIETGRQLKDLEVKYASHLNEAKSKIQERIAILNNFTTLQTICAMPCHILKPIGTRERLIYFIFIESAGFTILGDIVQEKGIEDIVMEMFGVGAFHENLGISEHDKKRAYRLLASKDPIAVMVSQRCELALSFYAKGERDLMKGALAGLINDKSVTWDSLD
jgi:hypothetical protein